MACFNWRIKHFLPSLKSITWSELTGTPITSLDEKSFQLSDTKGEFYIRMNIVVDTDWRWLSQVQFWILVRLLRNKFSEKVESMPYDYSFSTKAELDSTFGSFLLLTKPVTKFKHQVGALLEALDHYGFFFIRCFSELWCQDYLTFLVNDKDVGLS